MCTVLYCTVPYCSRKAAVVPFEQQKQQQSFWSGVGGEVCSAGDVPQILSGLVNCITVR